MNYSSLKNNNNNHTLAIVEGIVSVAVLAATLKAIRSQYFWDTSSGWPGTNVGWFFIGEIVEWMKNPIFFARNRRLKQSGPFHTYFGGLIGHGIVIGETEEEAKWFFKGEELTGTGTDGQPPLILNWPWNFRLLFSPKNDEDSLFLSAGVKHKKLRLVIGGPINSNFHPEGVIHSVFKSGFTKKFGNNVTGTREMGLQFALDIILGITGLNPKHYENIRKHGANVGAGFFPLSPFDFLFAYQSRMKLNEIFMEDVVAQQLQEDVLSENSTSIIGRMKMQGASDESIADNLGLFVIAGHDTTAAVLSTVTTILSQEKYGKILQRLREEIFRETANKEIEEVTIEFVANHLPYVRAFANEILRLFPPGNGVFREATENCELFGKKLPAKWKILFDFHSLHRNPKYWGSDVDEIIPERWLKDNWVTNKDPINYLYTFGNFTRHCLGSKLAMAEIHLFIVHLVKHLENFSLKTVTVEQHFTPFNYLESTVEQLPR